MALTIFTYIETSAQLVQQIPLDAYRLCRLPQFRPGSLGVTTLSLAYGKGTSLSFHLIGDTYADCPTDLLAFSIVIYLTLRSNLYQFRMPGSLFRTIAQDATLYFLVIFTSHLVLEVFILQVKVGIL